MKTERSIYRHLLIFDIRSFGTAEDDRSSTSHHLPISSEDQQCEETPETPSPEPHDGEGVVGVFRVHDGVGDVNMRCLHSCTCVYAQIQ